MQLDYKYHFDTALTEKLAAKANAHCSSNIPQTVKLSGMKDPIGKFAFTYATEVRIMRPEEFNDFELAEWFPQVERFSINTYPFHLNVHLPNLASFQLLGLKCGTFDLKSFGQRNPQIRSADLQICGQMENIAEVNELFPDLEALQLTLKRPGQAEESSELDRRSSVEFVRFRKVKSFTLDISHFNGGSKSVFSYLGLNAESTASLKLSSILFDQLDSFKYITEVHFYRNEQIDYVLQYQNVTSLDFSSIVMRYEEMKRLIESLPKLKEITLACSMTGAETFFRLMAETNLDTLNVRARDAERQDFLIFSALPEQWSLHEVQHTSAYMSNILTYKRNRVH